MSATIEVKYFNTFWLKKTVGTELLSNGGIYEYLPNFPGLPFEKYDTANNKTRYQNYWSITSGDHVIGDVTTNTSYNWFIEESRIKGGYNNTSTDYGVKAYLVNKDFVSTIRENKVIYSGLFNSATNVNETNVFSEATNITFTAPPEYGSIQRLYASDTKLHIFQQNKISRALLDKDAIYAADGQGTEVSTTRLVIGEINPYVGEYGISDNPESFDHFGNRMYFSDKNRNTVLRLAENGLTEIAKYGMSDFFRDSLAEVDSGLKAVDIIDTVDRIAPTWPYDFTFANVPPEPYLYKIDKGDGYAGVPIGSAILINGLETGCFVKALNEDVLAPNVVVEISDVIPFEFSEGSSITFRVFKEDKVLGRYDVYNDQYLISIQKTDNTYDTLVFDESSSGWVSFYDYEPKFADSLFNNFYSTSGVNLWKHNSEIVPRNTFYYNNPVKSSIEFVFNERPSVVKTFKTVNYEGSSGWEVTKMSSDETGFSLNGSGAWENQQDTINTVKSYYEGQYVEDGITKRAGFCRKENRYVANIVNNSAAQIGEVVFGSSTSGVKGYYTTVKLETDETTAPGEMKELFMVGTEYVLSSY